MHERGRLPERMVEGRGPADTGLFKIGDAVEFCGRTPANREYNPGRGVVSNVTDARVVVMFENFRRPRVYRPEFLRKVPA